MGDIGSYVENFVEYIIGLKIIELCVDLIVFVFGCVFDDDGNVLFCFDNGVKGVLYVSQIFVGEENDLNICVYGIKGGFYWCQMEFNILMVKWLDKFEQKCCIGVGELYFVSMVYV